MTIRPDDLKVGQWVAVSNSPEPEVTHHPFGGVIKSYFPVDGCPLKILAINLPFICVDAGHCTTSIDIRGLEFVRLSRKYVNAVQAAGYFGEEGWETVDSPVEFPKDRTCPMCEGPMVEYKSIGDEKWSIVCRECGFRGDFNQDDEVIS